MDSLLFVDQALEAYNLNREEIEKEQAKKEKEARFKDLTDEAEKFMDFLIEEETNLTSFLWYASEWLTGAEAKNTMIGFICHISTYFKIKAVWFFALGRAGEGKSFIDDHAHLLMPDGAVMNGRISDSALHRKALELGEDYLDGKILLMKDLGSKKDIEKWENTINTYKELTTEGESEIELTSESVDESTGERGVILFKLRGNSSVSLTSIHTESFDDQIMRRGVNVSPEATEEEARKFHYYNQGLVSKRRDEIINDEIGLLHKYIESIKEFYADIKVINPYWTCLEKWFKGGEFYKANLTLYPSLVKAVTLLNVYYREKIIIDGQQYVISTHDDNQMIADLFNPTQGISESALRVFNLMTKWYKPYDYKELEKYQEGELRISDCDTIFSSGEIKNKAYKIKALKGLPIGEIISNLVNHGLIEVVDKMRRGNNNVYCLLHYEMLDSKDIVFDEDEIMKYIHDLSWMYNVSPATLKNFVLDEKLENGGKYSIGNLKLPPWVSETPLLVPRDPTMSRNPIFLIPQNPANNVPQDPAKNETRTEGS